MRRTELSWRVLYSIDWKREFGAAGSGSNLIPLNSSCKALGMLFTATTFFLLYLPAALVGFFVLGAWSRNAAACWLFLASLFFYGYWMPEFTLLLVASITFNFAIGSRIAQARERIAPSTESGSNKFAKVWLIFGLAINLSLLAYFKYANFFVDNLNVLFSSNWQLMRVVLPLGISFYTFTQIAYLVDTFQGKVGETKFVHYGLFVTYFPHLIAGPVLHHAQMMPQFADAKVYRVRWAFLVGGLAIFCIGLFKKIVLADGISPYADAVFSPGSAGSLPSAQEGWLAAVAYSLQLYFDFSGYSDMAVGLSWMFNIRLPFNFDSPYRATSISDFWRRWHISLSTFLRDYLYVAMGGNRKGVARRHLNLATTMLLGGLWHGAGWSFVVWGALHGIFLAINHAFRAAVGDRVLVILHSSRLFSLASWVLTMLVVVVAWVFFRSGTLPGAFVILEAMFALGSPVETPSLLLNAGLNALTGLLWCAGLSALAVLLPNSNQIGDGLIAFLQRGVLRRGFVGGVVLAAALFLILMNAARDTSSAFIYFNF